MRDWLTLAELADLALPGWPATRAGWARIADAEGWDARAGKARMRAGKGGGLEYHIDLLPGVALAALAAKTIGGVALLPGDAAVAAAEEAAAADAAASEASRPAQLTLFAQEGRDARLALLAAAERFRASGAFTGATADRSFAALYNEGRIEVEP